MAVFHFIAQVVDQFFQRFHHVRTFCILFRQSTQGKRHNLTNRGFHYLQLLQSVRTENNLLIMEFFRVFRDVGRVV